MAERNSAEWQPMIWPGEWTAPGAIRLLEGSPVNCVVFLPADGNAARWEAIASEARRAGILALTASDSGFEPPAGVHIIPDGVWPKVATKADTDAIDAGPTGLPWIDSNGWRIRLSQALRPDSFHWVRFNPPQAAEVVRPSGYSIAAADCEAYGAKWLISLDSGLAAGILAGNGAARQTWKGLSRTWSFFRNLPLEGEMGSPGRLGILSDFAGDNEFLSHEFLNLIAREYAPVRILPKPAAVPPLDGVRMIVHLDSQPPPPRWQSAIESFVKAGGTLLTSGAADPGHGDPASPVAGVEYDIRIFGRGRIAVAREGFEDPWRLAADAHVLLGRANDLLRQANAGSMNISFMAKPGGERARLHIVNYSGRRGLNPVTLTFLAHYRSARFRSIEEPKAAGIPIHREYDRSAVYLPQFSVCATLELEA